MVGPLTSSPDVEAPDGDPLVVGVDDERADEVLSALSATTTRRVLAALHEDPAPPSALADRLDTSLQNVDYHLRKLLDAGLVEAAGTAYSEKGREMTVYAPADRALVFVASPASAGGTGGGLVATLKRLLGGVGVLGLASLTVERLLAPTARRGGDPDVGYAGNQSGTVTGGPGTTAGGGETVTDGGKTETDGAETVPDGGGGGGASTATEAAQTSTGQSSATEATTETARDAATTTTPQSTPSPEAAQSATGVAQTVTEAATTAVDAGAVNALAASPGLLFFLGGLTALALVAALRWRR